MNNLKKFALQTAMCQHHMLAKRVISKWDIIPAVPDQKLTDKQHEEISLKLPSYFLVGWTVEFESQKHPVPPRAKSVMH